MKISEDKLRVMIDTIPALVWCNLRERVDDIPLLVEYFIDRYAKKTGKNFNNITNKTFQLFQAYDWPGNIR